MLQFELALRLLRCVAMAAAKAGSAALLRPRVGTLVADGLAEAVPTIAERLWQLVQRPFAKGGVSKEDLRTAIAEVATLDAEKAGLLAAQAVEQEGGALQEQERSNLVAYLREVPATLRQSMRRPDDPSGRTIPGYQRLDGPDHLAILLPRRLPLLEAGRSFHGLELVRLLGSGGYGEVWQAVPKGVPGAEPVALKFCTDERARRQLLEHEAKVAAQVMRVGQHPGIVRLQRMYLEDELPALEFEFVAGGDLQAHLAALWARNRPFGVHEVLGLMIEVVQPFAHMHSAKPPIVHRDAKLANILVDENGRVRVTDFGIGGLAFVGEAVAESRRGAVSVARFTAVARGAYTPHYASREQMAGEDPDPADDVYSLGVIFYQMLTRRLDEAAPSGDWDDELRESGVDGAIVDVLKRALARTRERRYPNAGELQAALVRVRNHLGEPDSASRPTPAPAMPIAESSSESCVGTRTGRSTSVPRTRRTWLATRAIAVCAGRTLVRAAPYLLAVLPCFLAARDFFRLAAEQSLQPSAWLNRAAW